MPQFIFWMTLSVLWTLLLGNIFLMSELDLFYFELQTSSDCVKWQWEESYQSFYGLALMLYNNAVF